MPPPPPPPPALGLTKPATLHASQRRPDARRPPGVQSQRVGHPARTGHPRACTAPPSPQNRVGAAHAAASACSRSALPEHWSRISVAPSITLPIAGYSAILINFWTCTALDARARP